MDKGLFAFLCSCGSLLAVVTVYIGLMTSNKPITIIGQIVGALDLCACLVFLFLYL